MTRIITAKFDPYVGSYRTMHTEEITEQEADKLIASNSDSQYTQFYKYTIESGTTSTIIYSVHYPLLEYEKRPKREPQKS